MDCQTISRKLDELVDGELSTNEADLVQQHLSDCEACSRAYEGLVRLKALVRGAARHSSAPRELGSAIRLDMERARRVLPRGILLSAAALLLVALLVAIYMLSPGTPELGHAQVAKKFDDEYTICADKGRGAPRRGDREDVLRAIARDLKNKKIDLKLVELPYVADADYCGSCTQTFKFADGVEVEGLRLDFVTQKEAGPGAVICVFMLPTDAFPPRSKLLKGLSKPHYCACVPGMRNTIFCLATESSVFHFVTDLEKDIFKNAHTPSVEPLLASR